MLAHPLVNFIRRGPKADYERMAFKTGEIGFISRQTASGRDHGLLAARQLLDNAALPGAKGRLAVLFEDGSNLFSGAGFNHIVGIEKCKMQKIGGHPAHDRFSRAHESDEGQISNFPRSLHGNEVADWRQLGTWKLGMGE